MIVFYIATMTNAPLRSSLIRQRGRPREFDVDLAIDKATHMQRVDIDDTIIKGLQETADIYQQEGIVTKKIDVSQGFDKSFNASRARVAQATAQ